MAVAISEQEERAKRIAQWEKFFKRDKISLINIDFCFLAEKLDTAWAELESLEKIEIVDCLQKAYSNKISLQQMFDFVKEIEDIDLLEDYDIDINKFNNLWELVIYLINSKDDTLLDLICWITEYCQERELI